MRPARLFVGLILLALSASPARAITKGLMEGIPASNYAIMVDTVNARVGISTGVPQATLDVHGVGAFTLGVTASSLTARYGIQAASGTFFNGVTLSSLTATAVGNNQFSVAASSGISALLFRGDGAQLTGLMGTQLGNSSIQTAKLAADAVTTSAILNVNVTNAKLASDVFSTAHSWTAQNTFTSSVTASAFFGDGANIFGTTQRIVTPSNGTLGAGDTFYMFVAESNIRLTTMSVILNDAGEGAGTTAWRCGTDTTYLTANTDVTTALGQPQTTTGAAEFTTGQTISCVVSSSSQDITPTGAIEIAYVREQ